MSMENFDEASEEINNRRRKRAIKVFITEGFMVIAIICLVVLTTMVATGYNVKPSDDGLIERTGLVAIQSIPTGANIAIDADEIFGWTNLSRSMTQGEHEIVLSKEGYESWTKKINVTAGLYYRLSYPRLFLSNMVEEKIVDFSNIEQVSFAKSGDLMLAISKDSLKWQIWKINEDKPSMTELDLKKGFSDADIALFDGIEIKAWSGDNRKVLMRTTDEQWLIIDVKNIEKSLNLSSEFGLEFSDVKIANDSATEMYALENNHLRMIDIENNKVSGILVENVEGFYNMKSDVIYVTLPNEKNEFETGFYSKGNKEHITLSQMVFDESKPNVLVAMSEYYGEYYALEFVNNQVGIYKAERLPSSNEDDLFKAITVEEIGFVPDRIAIVGDGGLFAAQNGSQRAVFDVESTKFGKFTSDSEARWLDDFMIYEIVDGRLSVMDFDNENDREIASDVKDGLEIKISKNNKWIYFVNSENKLSRVKILE